MRNFTTAMKVFFILASVLVSIAFAASQEQTVEVKPDGDWKGTIDAGWDKAGSGPPHH